jgi:hypothetical protein
MSESIDGLQPVRACGSIDFGQTSDDELRVLGSADDMLGFEFVVPVLKLL